jgi:hypothetical protein
VTSEGFGIPQIVAALQSSMKFSVEMPQGEERGILVRAVRTVASGK